MQEEKTIKQLADELGVSKQAVAYQLKRLQGQDDDDKLSTKREGAIYLSLVAETLITTVIKDKDSQTVTAELPPSDSQTDSLWEVLKTTIELLQNQLTVKDLQLSEKDKNISELTQAITTQAQSINAYQHKELAETVAEVKLLDEPKRKWFKRKG